MSHKCYTHMVTHKLCVTIINILFIWIQCALEVYSVHIFPNNSAHYPCKECGFFRKEFNFYFRLIIHPIIWLTMHPIKK